MCLENLPTFDELFAALKLVIGGKALSGGNALRGGNALAIGANALSDGKAYE